MGPTPVAKGLPGAAVSAPLLELIVNAETAVALKFVTYAKRPTGTQRTTTVVTSVLVTVPLPFVTTQFWLGLVGWAKTVTLYAMPLGTAVANVKVPAADTLRLSPPLSRSTRPGPVRPVTMPPTL